MCNVCAQKSRASLHNLKAVVFIQHFDLSQKWLVHKGQEGLLVLWPKSATGTFLALGHSHRWQPFWSPGKCKKRLSRMWHLLASKSGGRFMSVRGARGSHEFFTFQVMSSHSPEHLIPRKFRHKPASLFSQILSSPSLMCLRHLLLLALRIQLTLILSMIELPPGLWTMKWSVSLPAKLCLRARGLK